MLLKTLGDLLDQLTAPRTPITVQPHSSFPNYRSIATTISSFSAEAVSLSKLNRTPSVVLFTERLSRQLSDLVTQTDTVVKYVHDIHKVLHDTIRERGWSVPDKTDALGLIGVIVGGTNTELLDWQKRVTATQDLQQTVLHQALDKQGRAIKLKVSVLQAQTRAVREEKQRVESQIEEINVQHKAVIDRAHKDIQTLLADKTDLEDKLKTALQEKKNFDEYLAHNGGSVERLNKIISEIRTHNGLLEQELAIIKSSVRDMNKTLNRKDREAVEAIRRVRELETDNFKIREAEKSNESFRTGFNVLTSVMQKYYIDKHELLLQQVDGNDQSVPTFLKTDADVVYKGNQQLYLPTFEQMLGQQ